jgi:hypothetical protein
MPFLLIPVGTQINELGLYSKYILAGAYICKLFDYAVQCSILENRIRQCTINYTHIGYRYTDLFPFTIEQISKRRKGPDGRGTTKKGKQSKRKTRKQQKKEIDKRKEINKRKERRSKNKNKSKKYGIRSL